MTKIQEEGKVKYVLHKIKESHIKHFYLKIKGKMSFAFTQIFNQV